MFALRRFLVAMLTTAVWLGGSMSPVLAAEPPSDVVIHGLVVVEDEAGDPMNIASATATVTYPGGPVEDVPVEIATDPGEYTITLHGWTESGTTVVTVDVVGVERRAPDPDSACELRVVDEASASLELAEPVAMEVLTIATPTVVGTVCPSVEPSAPAASMPPTDGLAPSDPPVPSASLAAAVLAMLATAVVAGVLTARRVSPVSRRGS